MKTVLDVETTIFQKGNPFSIKNKMVCLGLRQEKDVFGLPDIFYTEDYNIKEVQAILDNTKLLVGFNIKFDIHWIRRYGFTLPTNCRIWDCQLAHFILTGQSQPYPSLNLVAEYYGCGRKFDVVEKEFWDKRIDTDKIPREILSDYLGQDLLLTEEVQQAQEEHFKKESPNLLKLFKLQCLDLLVLEEMEFNGMFFDVKEAERLAEKTEKEIKEIEKDLEKIHPEVPINWDSRDHISCVLYGGIITIENRVPIGVYKTGAKIGQPRYKIIEINYELPQIIKPLRGSELKKKGFYATDEPTLRSLRGTKEAVRIINLLLQRAERSKLVGTYYRGIPDLIEEMDWPSNTIHGTFNQCVATTGRLSSSRPNLQNMAGDVDELLRSKYD